MRSVNQEGADRRSVRVVPTRKPPSTARVLRRSAIFRPCVRSNAVGKRSLKSKVLSRAPPNSTVDRMRFTSSTCFGNKVEKLADDYRQTFVTRAAPSPLLDQAFDPAGAQGPSFRTRTGAATRRGHTSSRWSREDGSRAAPAVCPSKSRHCRRLHRACVTCDGAGQLCLVADLDNRLMQDFPDVRLIPPVKMSCYTVLCIAERVAGNVRAI